MVQLLHNMVLVVDVINIIDE